MFKEGDILTCIKTRKNLGNIAFVAGENYTIRKIIDNKIYITSPYDKKYGETYFFVSDNDSSFYFVDEYLKNYRRDKILKIKERICLNRKI